MQVSQKPDNWANFNMASLTPFIFRLKNALKKTNCIPWDYPHPMYSNLAICTRDRVETFELHFENATEGCECPRACRKLEFRYTRDSASLDPELECKDKAVAMGAYSRINAGADDFYWIYSR